MKFPPHFVALTLGVASLMTSAISLRADTVYTSPYKISTVAGVIAGAGNQDGTGAVAVFNRPDGVAVDGRGNTYVADSSNNTIRLIDTNGVVTTIAGTAGKVGNSDGFGTNALFRGPWGIALDASTNLYVTDRGNNTVREIANVVVTNTVRVNLDNLTNTTGTTNTLTVNATVLITNYVGTNTAPSTNTVYATNSVSNTIITFKAGLTTTNVTTVTNGWMVITLAGSAQGATNGTNALARFNAPEGIAVDGNTNLYIADTGNNTIRKVIPVSGPVWVATTLAGTAGTSGSADGNGTNALFNGPAGLALDAGGNLYVADQGNETIRRIDPLAQVTTFAGQAGVPGKSNGTGVNALFNTPTGLAMDASTNLYVTDSGNYLIRRITAGAVVSTYAGTGTNGNANGVGTNASFDLLVGIATTTNAGGSVVVADNGNNRIRLLSTNATVTSLAGQGFFQPFGVALDAKANIYLTDTGNNVIRKIDVSGITTILAGQVGVSGSADGFGTNATFNQPLGLTLDGSTNLFISDSGNNAIRKITPVIKSIIGPTNTLSVTTAIGRTNTLLVTNTTTTTITVTVAGTNITTNTTGSAFFSTSATNNITNTVITTNWVSTNTVLQTNWVATNVAGRPGIAGSADGVGTNATFNGPDGIAIDGQLNLYVMDTGNNTMRKIIRMLSTNSNAISTNWSVTTPVGTPGVSGTNDGTNALAQFNSPEGIALDGSTNLYISDSGNETIREITHSGTNWVVRTIAGIPGVSGGDDGAGPNATFSTPFGITANGQGVIYISDSGNQTIRRISLNGIVSTMAGTPGIAGNVNGTGSNASFYQPAGMTVNKNNNNIYIADVNNNEIREGIPSTTPSKVQNIRFQSIPRQAYTGTNVLILKATATSGLPVTFTSADSKVATISGNVLTVRGAGSVLISASQEGSDLYKPAPNAKQLLIVFKGTPHISMDLPASVPYAPGTTVALVATNTANLPVVFASANTNALFIDPTNTVSFSTNSIMISSNDASVTGVGITTVTATQPSSVNYNAASASRVLNVIP
jgi:mucin-19